MPPRHHPGVKASLVSFMELVLLPDRQLCPPFKLGFRHRETFPHATDRWILNPDNGRRWGNVHPQESSLAFADLIF